MLLWEHRVSLNLGSSDEQKKRVRQGPGQGVGSHLPQGRSPGTGAALWARADKAQGHG